MPRPESPVAGSGPQAEFAKLLRAKRDASGITGLRALATRTHLSPATLSRLFSGRVKPSWSLVRAVLEACETGPDELAQWHDRWEALDTGDRLGQGGSDETRSARLDPRISVFLLDDHELVLTGLRHLLDAEPDLEVVGQATSQAEALALIPKLRPQVAILDVRLPDGEGITVCREILSRLNPPPACLMLTSFLDEEAQFAAIVAGASGYLLKQSSGNDVLAAVRAVAAGDKFFDADGVDELLKRIRGEDELEPGPAYRSLTAQERRILDLVAEGKSNRQIAATLFLAEKTVKNYVSSLLHKLGFERRTGAAVYMTRLRSTEAGSAGHALRLLSLTAPPVSGTGNPAIRQTRPSQADSRDLQTRAYELHARTQARRVTELYAKAVEQLGSDKAPVRLGGIYALERVAQDHPGQRQAIVSVMCAYLRMPYTVPGASPVDDADPALVATYRERVQELDVRLSAQRVLTHHLRPGDDPSDPIAEFWAGIDLDLTAATLIDLDLSHTDMHTATFVQAQFVGDAWFSSAKFTDGARFDQATFAERAQFDETLFNGFTTFTQAQFAGDASFSRACFQSDLRFTGAEFLSAAWFDRVKFSHSARFDQVTFASIAQFEEAQFDEAAGFEAAQFLHAAWFVNARFSDDVSFRTARFNEVCPRKLMRYL